MREICEVDWSMAIYPYVVRYDEDKPFETVDTMPRVEANSTLDAVDKLWRFGRLPKSGPLYYVCLVTETHDNGFPYKVLSVPVEPQSPSLAGG